MITKSNIPLFRRLLLAAGLLLLLSARSAACTSVIVSGRATKDGRPMIFKHRDTSAANNVMVLVQGERYRYLGITGASDTKPRNIWGGHNEVGFAIVNTAAYNLNGCKGDDSDHDGWLMRRALEVCRTQADFEHLIDTLPKPLNVNSNYGVLDAEGGCAYYETGDQGFVKFDANDPREAPDGYIVRTNHGMTGCRDIDSGVERYMAISDFMAQALREGHIDCEYLVTQIPRYLTHGLTKQNLYDQLPKNRDDVRLIHFADFIPRYLSSSAILVQGIAPGEDPLNTVSWTNIGWPCGSVTIPLMIRDGVALPSFVMRGEDGKSWICTRSIEQKLKVFCLTRGNKRDYIDLSKLINADGTGIVQRIMPLEREVLKRARKPLQHARKDKSDTQALNEYYRWADEYVRRNYPSD